MTIPYAELRRNRKADPEFRKELEALGTEFELARALVETRGRGGLSQSEDAAVGAVIERARAVHGGPVVVDDELTRIGAPAREPPR